MSTITNDKEFRAALKDLDYTKQRLVAALLVEHVLSLSDDDRLKRVIKTASDIDASTEELSNALKTAKATTFDSHARCGSEGNWTDQAGYFVARAAVAAVTPESQTKGGGPAWQAAMSSRMAQTSELIDSDDENPTDNQWQYEILTNFLNL